MVECVNTCLILRNTISTPRNFDLETISIDLQCGNRLKIGKILFVKSYCKRDVQSCTVQCALNVQFITYSTLCSSSNQISRPNCCCQSNGYLYRKHLITHKLEPRKPSRLARKTEKQKQNNRSNSARRQWRLQKYIEVTTSLTTWRTPKHAIFI